MTTPTEAPVTAEYYYKVKWGYQDEFIELFRKNHYPVLMEQVKSGRLLKFQAFEPRFHGEGRSDWTFMTVLVFKNWQAFGDGSGTEAIIQRLYPDQATYKHEERRRFEILDAHWDVPLKPVSME
jgi:hypothetical protein